MREEREILIKAIIFDAYGTLIDTGDGSIEATKLILNKNGYFDLDPKEFYSKWKWYHRQHIDSITTFINEAEIFLMDLKALYSEYNILGKPEEDVKIMLATLGVRVAFPETVPTINILRQKYQVVVGSTSDHETLLLDLKRNGIVVNGCFSSELLREYKPNNQFYERLLDRLNCKAHEVIFVGDSLVDDVQGPSSVGIKAIWVNRKKQVAEKIKPYYVVSNLSELLDIL